MQVLNTFTKTTPSHAFFALLVLFIVTGFLIWLLGGDITRFIEHHTIGSAIYDYASKAWIVLLSVLVIVAIFVLPKNLDTKVYAEATIIEQYPIGALYSKYDIVEKRGDLWVLELRDSYEEQTDAVEEEVSANE